MTELYQHAQKYNSQLQEYNGKMQAELQAANESMGKVQARHALLRGSIVREGVTPDSSVRAAFASQQGMDFPCSIHRGLAHAFLNGQELESAIGCNSRLTGSIFGAG
jgi:hypothetical protein